MFNYIAQNLATILIGAVVFIIIVAVIVKMIKDKINHKSSCGCGCSGCKGAKRCDYDE